LPLGVGITLEGRKAQVVPAGRFVRSHDSVTFVAVALPLVRVAMIVVKPEFPGVSATPPVFDRV